VTVRGRKREDQVRRDWLRIPIWIHVRMLSHPVKSGQVKHTMAECGDERQKTTREKATSEQASELTLDPLAGRNVQTDRQPARSAQPQDPPLPPSLIAAS
jgi:hypothetical protein